MLEKIIRYGIFHSLEYWVDENDTMQGEYKRFAYKMDDQTEDVLIHKGNFKDDTEIGLWYYNDSNTHYRFYL